MSAHRIERLHDWFDLQFSLVETLTDKCGIPFARAVTHYTNLHRRFGYGRPGGEAPATKWLDFLAELDRLETRAKRVESTMEFGRGKLISDRPIGRPEFGCFNFDGPSEQGVVRIHFAANDGSGGCGPLSAVKSERRRGELAEMFAYVRRISGESARYVAGVSWLYNLESYRRLLPDEFANSRVVYKSPSMTLAGLPFWGQFLDYEENIKPALRNQFLSNLKEIDLSALWKLFPMPVMLTRAPISAFYDHYAV